MVQIFHEVKDEKAPINEGEVELIGTFHLSPNEISTCSIT